jgi:hypothetical protein
VRRCQKRCHHPNRQIWSYPLEKHVLSTPAIRNGLVFIADCGRKFHCVDSETGKAHWTHEIKGEVWASALVADGKVYLGTRSGNFYVFAAALQKELIARPLTVISTHRRQRHALCRDDDPALRASNRVL